MVNEASHLQPAKAPLPIEVTELGIVTEVRPVQPEKEPAPIVVTELPMMTEVRPVQNAYLLLVDYQYYTL